MFELNPVIGSCESEERFSFFYCLQDTSAKAKLQTLLKVLCLGFAEVVPITTIQLVRSPPQHQPICTQQYYSDNSPEPS